jgi:hypothetical protein
MYKLKFMPYLKIKVTATLKSYTQFRLNDEVFFHNLKPRLCQGALHQTSGCTTRSKPNGTTQSHQNCIGKTAVSRKTDKPHFKLIEERR